jgi:hypothetical protein
MNIEKAFRDNRLSKALTGMTIDEIDSLLITFEQVYTREQHSKKRIRKPGGGRKGSLPSLRHKLFFILFYFKCYPTFDLAAFILDNARSKAHRWVSILMPILQKALGRELVLPARQVKTIEDLFKNFPEAKELFIDGTERKCQRPKTKKNRDRKYSGKKKCYTRKNIIISNKDREILYLSPTKNGRKHDFNITKREELPKAIPPELDVYLDTGFQGIKDLVKNLDNIFMPKKKPRGAALTRDEKELNQIISSIRIKVEHAIAGIKRFNCLSHIFRNKKGQDDQFMNITCGLWNYHLRFSQ